MDADGSGTVFELGLDPGQARGQGFEIEIPGFPTFIRAVSPPDRAAIDGNLRGDGTECLPFAVVQNVSPFRAFG
jgi:hypothetical protein